MDGVHPTFSFLTTAYRTEAYLPTTIESVRAQSRPDWELIVVDNGYSDAVAAVVRSYDDRRIRLVRQPNHGYAGGVGAAAAASHGQVICVLDSDDLLLPRFCAVVGKMLDTEPGVAAVGCDALLFDDTDGTDRQGYLRSLGIRRRPNPTRTLTLEHMLAGRIPYYTGAIRRAAWFAVGGYDNGGRAVEEDVVLWLRLAQAGYDVRLLPDRLARCRIRGDSASRDPESVDAFEERLQASFRTVAEAAETEPVRATLDATLRRLRYHQALRRARGSLLSGDVPTARVQARTAYAQRHTLRAAAVAAAVHVAPTALRTVHPLKQRAAAALRIGAGSS